MVQRCCDILVRRWTSCCCLCWSGTCLLLFGFHTCNNMAQVQLHLGRPCLNVAAGRRARCVLHSPQKPRFTLYHPPIPYPAPRPRLAPCSSQARKVHDRVVVLVEVARAAADQLPLLQQELAALVEEADAVFEVSRTLRLAGWRTASALFTRYCGTVS